MAVEFMKDYFYGRSGSKTAGYFLGRRLYNSGLEKARGGLIPSKSTTFLLIEVSFL